MTARTLPPTRTAAEVRIGDSLPEWPVVATPTFVISTALATRDYQDVHHDRDAAIARGSQDIFVNILTTTGLTQRYVTDWAGPEALVRNVSIRLGVPCYAYDTMTFFGQVVDRVTEHGEDRFVLDVLGRTARGDHVTGTVRIVLPGGVG
ncbi:MAG TPA: acyl dehydratase [Pseudonocardiaceae bacterium]|jgi:hypothetical protein|nr:acyl dehydratase [Pseudonocardiaceae bacterium]